MYRHAFALLAAAALTGAASAQSMNIDFQLADPGMGGGLNNGIAGTMGPYGAALNQPGFWNAAEFAQNSPTGALSIANSANPNQLTLLDGSTLSGVTLTLTMPGTVPPPFIGNTPAGVGCAPWGPADLQLYDGVVFPDPFDGSQLIYELQFNGLAPGTYTLFTYAHCEFPGGGKGGKGGVGGVGGNPPEAPFTIVYPINASAPARVIENRCPGFPAIHAFPHTFIAHTLTVPASGLLRIQLSTLDHLWGFFCLSGMQLRQWPPAAAVGANYCASSINGSGTFATISALSTPALPITMPSQASSFANDLLLMGTGLVPGVSCAYIYGTTQTALPVQNGILCVGGVRVSMNPKALTDGTGASFFLVDNTDAQNMGNMTSGQTRNFQIWYLDPGFGTGENLSDAISITFGP